MKKLSKSVWCSLKWCEHNVSVRKKGCQQEPCPVNFTLFWLPWHNAAQYTDPLQHTHTLFFSLRFRFSLQRFRSSTRASFSVNVAYLAFHWCPIPLFLSPPTLSLFHRLCFLLWLGLCWGLTPPQSPLQPCMLFVCCLLWMRSAEPLQDVLQRLIDDLGGLSEWRASYDSKFGRAHKHNTPLSFSFWCLWIAQNYLFGVIFY